MVVDRDDDEEEHSTPFWMDVIGVLLTNVIPGIAAYPFLTIERAFMMQAGEPTKAFRTWLECSQYLWRSGGLRVFFAGLELNIISQHLAQLYLSSFIEQMLVILVRQYSAFKPRRAG
jgi:hypothetical protein